MENKFIINDDERQRILSLHENSTKNQYLNLINEADMVGNGDESFYTPQYSSTNLNISKPTKQYNGVNYTTQNEQTFISAVGGKKIKVPSQTIVTVDQTNKKLNIGKYLIFKCKPITVSSTPFYYSTFDGKINYGNQGSTLTNNLRKRYCKGTELKSNDEILGKKTQPNVDKGKVVGGKVVGGKVVGGNVVIPTDIDLSQITKELPAELQTVLTPPTVDGQPNTGGQPDFNQLLTQLQGLS